ncbi:MAG: SDR family NAD(P)-dependent oxidoreductase [Alphaproteobacteria bacterium]
MAELGGKLDGKVAIITGGSGGIGRAAAKLFAAAGGRIILVDLDDDDSGRLLLQPVPSRCGSQLCSGYSSLIHAVSTSSPSG